MMADLKNRFQKEESEHTSNQFELDRLQYVNSIYEMAIRSAGIGIFYYDVEQFGINHFEANDTYANLLGFKPNAKGLYLLSDFQASLMETEEGLANQISIRQSLTNLLHGEVDGTDNELLKMRNLKSGQIKYFISSSRIDERYEDGRPRRFGGSIFDITDRVNREKNQMTFA